MINHPINNPRSPLLIQKPPRSEDVGRRFALLAGTLSPILNRLSGLLVERLGARFPFLATLELVVLPENPPVSPAPARFLCSFQPGTAGLTRIQTPDPRAIELAATGDTWLAVCSGSTTLMTEYYAGRIISSYGRAISPLFLYFFNVLFDRLATWSTRTVARNRVLGRLLPVRLLDVLITGHIPHVLPPVPVSALEAILVGIRRIMGRSGRKKPAKKRKGGLNA